MPAILKIFIAEHCSPCQRAIEIAAQIERLFPQADIQLIDVEKSPGDVPENVFATPTYILNNKIISLGNPSLLEIIAQLQKLMPEITP